VKMKILQRSVSRQQRELVRLQAQLHNQSRSRRRRLAVLATVVLATLVIWNWPSETVEDTRATAIVKQ